MDLALATVPAHRDPNAEDQVAGHVREQHEQKPPHLGRELEVLLLAQVHHDQVERHGENQQHDRGRALGEDEQQHRGHPTWGVAS